MAKSKKTKLTLSDQVRAAIKEAIDGTDVTLNRLASEVGVPRASLHRLLTKERSLSLDAAGKVLDFLGYELVKRD